MKIDKTFIGLNNEKYISIKLTKPKKKQILNWQKFVRNKIYFPPSTSPQLTCDDIFGDF